MTAPVAAVGDTAEMTREVTAADIEKFTEISGDRNPLHYDEEAAGASRFGEIVVQGGVTSAILNAVVAEKLPGPGTVFLNVELGLQGAGPARRHDHRPGRGHRRPRRQADRDPEDPGGPRGRDRRPRRHGGDLHDGPRIEAYCQTATITPTPAASPASRRRDTAARRSAPVRGTPHRPRARPGTRPTAPARGRGRRRRCVMSAYAVSPATTAASTSPRASSTSGTCQPGRASPTGARREPSTP